MKKINIATLAFLALIATTANAQTTGTTNTDATLSVTAVSAPAVTTGLPPLPPKPPALTPSMNATIQPRMLPPTGTSTRLGTTTPPNAGINQINRQMMEKRAMELRASTTAARENMKDLAQKKRLEIAQKKTELVNKRLIAAVERIQKLSDRVTERLNALEKNGVNVSVSRGHIEEADIKLEEARTGAAAVKLAIETAFASTTPASALKGSQEIVKAVIQTIQGAQHSVAEAISSIKPGLNKARPATTTPATATTSATTTQ